MVSKVTPAESGDRNTEPSSAAAPIVRDSMTYLFDQQKAFAALEPLEKQWGGTLAERNARQLATFKTASA